MSLLPIFFFPPLEYYPFFPEPYQIDDSLGAATAVLPSIPFETSMYPPKLAGPPSRVKLPGALLRSQGNDLLKGLSPRMGPSPRYISQTLNCLFVLIPAWREILPSSLKNSFTSGFLSEAGYLFLEGFKPTPSTSSLIERPLEKETFPLLPRTPPCLLFSSIVPDGHPIQ